VRKPNRNQPRRWRARKAARFGDEQAQKIGERLEKVAERLGIPYVKLTTDQIYEDAHVKSSPLHVQVEWDDEIAAEFHRKGQIRNVMNHLDIEVTDDDGTVRRMKAFFNVRLEDPEEEEEEEEDLDVDLGEDEEEEDAPGRAYVDHEALDDNPSYRRDFVTYCEKKMRHFARLVRDYGESRRFRKILKAIDDYEKKK
jgi:hypothetical protein